jgi:hypothetical protein
MAGPFARGVFAMTGISFNVYAYPLPGVLPSS